MEPPLKTQKSGRKVTKVEKKAIRGRAYESDSDEDNDVED